MRGLTLRETAAGERSLAGVRSDACWSFGASLAESMRPAEALLGLVFQLCALRYALEAGDVRRAIDALATYIMAVSFAGPRGAERTARLLARLEPMMERDGMHSSRCENRSATFLSAPHAAQEGASNG